MAGSLTTASHSHSGFSSVVEVDGDDGGRWPAAPFCTASPQHRRLGDSARRSSDGGDSILSPARTVEAQIGGRQGRIRRRRAEIRRFPWPAALASRAQIRRRRGRIRWFPWPAERRRGEIRAQAAAARVAQLPGAGVGVRRGSPASWRALRPCHAGSPASRRAGTPGRPTPRLARGRRGGQRAARVARPHGGGERHGSLGEVTPFPSDTLQLLVSPRWISSRLPSGTRSRRSGPRTTAGSPPRWMSPAVTPAGAGH